MQVYDHVSEVNEDYPTLLPEQVEMIADRKATRCKLVWIWGSILLAALFITHIIIQVKINQHLL